MYSDILIPTNAMHTIAGNQNEASWSLRRSTREGLGSHLQELLDGDIYSGLESC